MATYTNPSGTLNATDGDDIIVFNAPPASSATFDALGGKDSLLVQFDSASPVRIDVSDEFGGGYFNVGFSVNPFAPVSVQHLESVDLHGTANDDSFWLRVKPSSSALTVAMDGGGGQDLLRLDWSTLSSSQSFVVNGSAISSSIGTFANLETFYIFAGSGNDTIVTGPGDDYISTGLGVDQVSTGAGGDNIDLMSIGGTVDAGADDDRVAMTLVAGTTGFAGSVDGGTGQDVLRIDASALTTNISIVVNGPSIASNIGGFANFETFNIYGGSAGDTITTGSGDDIVWGNGGNDTISAGNGKNDVSGGDGNDTISAGAGNDILHGNRGNDIISGGDGADTIYGDDNVFSSVGDGNDQIDGGAGNDTIYGGGGDDTIIGGDGNDFLVGGRGFDYIDGGDGDDNIAGFGEGPYGPNDNLPNVLLGGAGNDSITAGYGDTVDGGTGTDSLYYNAFGGAAGITADFSKLTGGGTIILGGVTLTGIEFVNDIGGTNYNDTIIAGATNGAGRLHIDGYGGDDVIIGTSNDDFIDGGDGNDVIIGGAGSDLINGAAGIDTYKGTAADLNNDAISSIEAGERIVITDANPNTFTFSFDGNVLAYSGGALTLSGSIPGRLVASAAPEGGVQIKVEPLPVATMDQLASQLTTGFWNGDSHHWAVTQGGTLTVNISTLNPAEQTLARTALQAWTDIIGVHFQEVSKGGQIVFDHSEDPSGPIAATNSTWSNGIISSAHIQISSSWVNNYGTSLNSYSFQTYVHEIGHALGLGHSGNYNVDADYQIGALFANDGWPLTVMSYFDQQENRYFWNQGFSYGYILTPGQADIVAMQSLYGLSATTRASDTIYGYHSNAGTVYDASFAPSASFTIFDSGGTDTLDYSGFSGFQQIDLNPETFSRVNGSTGTVSIARGVIIENAIGGTGIDVIIGNSAENILTGGAGTDTLTGGAGADTFKDTAAGLNGDTITDFSPGDKIVITDANLAGFSFSLSGNTLTYTGGSLTLTGVMGQLVASAAAGGGVQLSALSGFAGFGPGELALAAFGYGADSGGWQSDERYPRTMADLNGDGRGDVIGFGEAGVYVALANGSGSFAPSFLARSEFGAGDSAGGWTSDDRYPRVLADVDGDHRADIIGFGENGVYVALGNGDGTFAPSTIAAAQWGASAGAGGWASNDRFPRAVADVNGDGRADIVGFGSNGVYVSLANTNGTFAAAKLASSGDFDAWLSQGGRPRELVDVNGDNRADIVGFGDDGVHVALANADGTFAPSILGSHEFGAGPAAGGWSSNNIFHREVGDVNGDGFGDIVGFGANGVYVALGNGNGTFAPSVLDINAFGYGPSGGSWASQDHFPRHLADINGDGAVDILGFGNAGVYVAYSHGDLW